MSSKKKQTRKPKKSTTSKSKIIKNNPKAVQIINFDKKLEEFKDKKSINKHFLMPQWPFRFVVVSPTGGGKSNLVLNLLENDCIHFDRLFVFAKVLDEDKWQFIKDIRDRMQAAIDHEIEKHPEQFEDEDGNEIEIPSISIFSSNLDDLPTLDEIDKEEQTLVVFDDFVNERDKANIKIIEDFFIMSRKKNCSIIFMAQQFHKCPTMVKTQASHIAAFKLGNKRCITELAKTCATRVDHKRFLELFREATSEPFSFMLIDMKTENPHLHLRCGFDNCLISI